jgi:hypothetical protein
VGKDDERAAAHLWQAAVGERLAHRPGYHLRASRTLRACVSRGRHDRPASRDVDGEAPRRDALQRGLVYSNNGGRGGPCAMVQWSKLVWGRGGRATRQDHGHGHDRHSPELATRGHHARRIEYKMVRATMPFPANPMETKTGFERPGTFIRTTSIEYAGEVAGHAVKPWRTRQ